jgi:hypothetical protein
MKTRWKIVLTILAATIYFALVQNYGAHCPSGTSVTEAQMNQTYSEFNQEYFHDRLPHDVVIDFGESVAMATTVKMADGRFHIAFNEKYNQSARQMRETMLHEVCHVKTWHPLAEQTPEDILTGQHGNRWRACMLQLDMAGAFRREIIDYYQGE